MPLLSPACLPAGMTICNVFNREESDDILTTSTAAGVLADAYALGGFNFELVVGIFLIIFAVLGSCVIAPMTISTRTRMDKETDTFKQVVHIHACKYPTGLRRRWGSLTHSFERICRWGLRPRVSRVGGKPALHWLAVHHEKIRRRWALTPQIPQSSTTQQEYECLSCIPVQFDVGNAFPLSSIESVEIDGPEVAEP
jgi:hypothetical protein